MPIVTSRCVPCRPIIIFYTLCHKLVSNLILSPKSKNPTTKLLKHPDGRLVCVPDKEVSNSSPKSLSETKDCLTGYSVEHSPS